MGKWVFGVNVFVSIRRNCVILRVELNFGPNNFIVTYVITNTWPITKVSFFAIFIISEDLLNDKTKRNVSNKHREVIMAVAKCGRLGLNIDEQCTNWQVGLSVYL